MQFAAKITGTGSAFPKTCLSNDDVIKKILNPTGDIDAQWIQDRTGIIHRRHSIVGDPDEYNSSLGVKASLKALDMAGKTAKDIDQIIYATCTPDTILPSSACWLQHKIGADRAWAMDLNAACSGFVYGLATAQQFIMTGNVKTSLVIGAEVLSSLINWNDQNLCILFGDGAGAAVVERAPQDSDSRVGSNHLLSDGNHWELLHVRAGGSKMETTPQRYDEYLHKAVMDGRSIFKIAVKTLAEFAEIELKKNNLTVDTMDWLLPHQANLRIIEAVAKRLKIPNDKILINVDQYGNTSSATVPTMLDEAVRDGRIKRGQTVLLDAFGAGLTYGAITLKW